MRTYASAGIAFLSLCSLVGCSDGTVNIKGKVALDGAPLPDGRIAFVSQSGGTGGSATIKSGEYSLKATPGNYQVQITAEKTGPLPKGKEGMFGKTEGTYQFIPDRYNSQSELKVTIPPTGSTDFDLKSN